MHLNIEFEYYTNLNKMAHFYDDDSDDMDMAYPSSGFGGAPYLGMDNKAPSFGPGTTAFGQASAYGGVGGFGGMGSDPLAGGIGFGQASKFGGLGENNNPFGMSQPSMGFGGGDALQTDYVDLSKIKAPEVPKHQPNKFATSSKSSMKKPGKKTGGRGVSFGDVTTFHVDKESQQTETDKKSNTEDNDEDDSDEDEDDIENEALNKNLKEKSEKEEKSDLNLGSIAAMLKKMTNIEESVTEGSIGLKKSVDSEEYKISSSNDEFSKFKKKAMEAKKQKSPSGLSDSDEQFVYKSQELDSNKKLSSEYDSAELSRNFNYEESQETNKFKPRSEKSKKSGDGDTEYDDDFEASSNLHESSSMNKPKKSPQKEDDIADIRKRTLDYKANLDSFRSGMKSPEDHEEEISKRLDSYRVKDEIMEDAASTTPKAESTSILSGGLNDAKLSADEKKLSGILHATRDPQRRSLEYSNEDLTKDKYEAEIQAKQFEMDAKVSRMEALNAVETNKLLKEKIIGYVQDINQYRVEIEGLKRQVDIADSNAKSKTDELNQITDEYENKIKLEREKNAHSNIRQESREINELKREVRLLKAAHEQEAQEKFEEIDYLTKRCEKLESENVALRVGNKAVRDAENKAKKYEEETHSLRMRLKEQMKSKEAQPITGSNYNNWTKDQLVRELMSIDRAIERFTKENENLMHENKKQSVEIQQLNSMLYAESQKLQDYKHKIIKETGSVMIVENDHDLNTQVLNDLGVQHAISQKEFNEIKEKLFKAEKLNLELKQDYEVKEIDYKNEIEKIRTQRVESERKQISLDSALKTQFAANEKLKEDFTGALTKLQTEKEEATQKLEWYMENQDLLDKDVDLLRQKDERIDELKEEIREIKVKDGGRKRMAVLEKQIKDLQEALKKKHPDSIPMMLNAVKPSFEEEESYRKLKQENEKLKKTLQDKDDEFDKKIRNLRVEIDKMKARYDHSKATPLPADLKDKRIQDLERQVQETKEYYMDRVKKLQEEAKQGPNSKVGKIKGEMKHLKEIEAFKKEIDTIKKSKKKLENEIAKHKKGSQDKSINIGLAINALMEEDYVFSLCGLYKNTLSIKKAIEKNVTFEAVLRSVEELIDEFEKASNVFKSNKATILFSKVTDKCVELSKVIQKESTGQKDKSKPHSKLTAIEHLLKDEIENSIGSKLDQNQDLTVVEVDESVNSKRGLGASPKKPQEDEEDYWSDFSDDDYTQEINEDKKASEILSSLQRWIYNSNLETELAQKYPNTEIISLDDFKEALNEAGYYCEFLDLQALLKRLDISKNFGVNYREFLTNINEKNAAWWKESLSNNSFDITGKGKRNGNYRPLCSQPIYEFIINNLGEKTKQAINRAGYLNVSECIEELFDDHPEGLTKRELRNQFLEKGIPLTRLDTHLLFKTLEDPSTGLVDVEDMKRYVDDSEEYVIAKGIGMTEGANVWIEEEVIDDDMRPKGSKKSQYEEQLQKLQLCCQAKKIKIEEKLRSFDKTKKGIVNRQLFLFFCKDIECPLTTIEQKGLISHLILNNNGQLTIPDLSNILSKAPQAPKAPKVPKPNVKPSKPDVKPAPKPGVRPSPKPAPISPSKTDDINEQRLAQLEATIKEKNKLIISLEKKLTDLESLAVPRSNEKNTLEKENKSLNKRLKESEEKYLRDKKKLEQLIKENISTPEAGDFILLQKKIEFLEQSMLEREKDIHQQSFRSSFNSRDKQELKQLKEQLESERGYYNNVIERKNNEIKMFREELNILLKELDEVKAQTLEKERLFMQQKSNLIS